MLLNGYYALVRHTNGRFEILENCRPGTVSARCVEMKIGSFVVVRDAKRRLFGTFAQPTLPSLVAEFPFEFGAEESARTTAFQHAQTRKKRLSEPATITTLVRLLWRERRLLFPALAA